MKNNFLPIAFVAVALILFGSGYFLGQGKDALRPASSNILFLTNPVTTFSGKVDKVEGSFVLVSQQITLSQPFGGAPVAVEPGKGTPSPFPTPISKVLTFKVNVTQNTQINRPQPFIPYLAKSVTPAPPPKLTIKDIKVGQMISVNTNTDLRTLTTNTFEATSIQLPGLQNNLQGKISKISGNTIIMKATPPQPPAMGTTPQPPTELDYTVTVTSATEISRYKPSELPKPGESPTPGVPPPPQVEELKIEDLKVDMQITVFAAEDVVSTQKLTAMRIEPFFPPPTPIPAPIEPTIIILPPSPAATSPANPSL